MRSQVGWLSGHDPVSPVMIGGFVALQLAEFLQRSQVCANARDAIKEAFGNGTASRRLAGNARCCSVAMAMRQHSLSARRQTTNNCCHLRRAAPSANLTNFSVIRSLSPMAAYLARSRALAGV